MTRRRNPIAKAVRTSPALRPRVVPARPKYRRKPKHTKGLRED